MSEHPKVVRLAGRNRTSLSRLCLLPQPEEYRMLLPFAQEGFERGERGFHIVDARHRQERWQQLAQLGIDVAEAERRGLIEVRVWEEAHLREGQFDQYAMLS